METLKEAFTSFLAWRLESEGETATEKEIREKLSNLPDETMERVNHLCGVVQNQAYWLGFTDSLRIMAGF